MVTFLTCIHSKLSHPFNVNTTKIDMALLDWLNVKWQLILKPAILVLDGFEKFSE